MTTPQDKTTALFWMIAFLLLFGAILWVHYDNSAGKNAPPAYNVHTTPTPRPQGNPHARQS